MKDPTKAERFAQLLTDNGESYHHGQVTHEEFTRRNEIIWQAIEARGIVMAVQAALRERNGKRGGHV